MTVTVPSLRRAAAWMLLVVGALAAAACAGFAPCHLGSSAGTVYYVDSDRGEDANPGTAQAQAWKSLARVNKTVFQPGDRILFKAGTVYKGQLKPQGSGAAGRPIIIDRYGKGAKPRIDGEGKVLDALLLRNVQYWEVANLEITNQGPTRANGRTGVHLLADSSGTLHHFVLRNLDVHDVNGSLAKRTEGCGILWDCRGTTPSCFDLLLIENCHLARTDRNGICGVTRFSNRTLNALSKNVVIRRNLLEDIGGDGIKPWGCQGALVEHNILRGAGSRMELSEASAGIWPFASDDTVIQFNEVSGMRGGIDAQGYDSDYDCRNTLFQYNYSHDNEGGFMLICCPTGRQSGVGNAGTVIRYNISQNDGFRASGPRAGNSPTFYVSGPCTSTTIYNNVIFIGKNQKIQLVKNGTWGGGWAKDTRFYNNIFVTQSAVPAYVAGQSVGTVFSHNAFFGPFTDLPADPAAILKDPLLVAPGNGKDGVATLDGYQLKADSPCIGAGLAVKNNGGRDFWGHPVAATGNPDIGAQAFTAK